MSTMLTTIRNHKNIIVRHYGKPKRFGIKTNPLVLLTIEEFQEWNKDTRIIDKFVFNKASILPHQKIYYNLWQSVVLPNRLIKRVNEIFSIISNRKADKLRKKYPNADNEEIQERLSDCKAYLYHRLEYELKKLFPERIIKPVLDVWKYEQDFNTSRVTYQIKFRRLQEALFKNEGSITERINSDNRRKLRTEFYDKMPNIADKELDRLLDSYTDFMPKIANYNLTEKQLSKLSDAEKIEYIELKNQKVDNELRELGNQIKRQDKQLSKKERSILEYIFNDKEIEIQQEGNIPQHNYKETRAYKTTEPYIIIKVQGEHDTKEENLKPFIQRPNFELDLKTLKVSLERV